MKSARPRVSPVFILLAAVTAATASARAQTPPVLPPLEVSPSTVAPDGTVTVSLPANFPLNNTRWRIGIWEHARPAFLGDVVRDFTVRDGGLRATIHVEADPGIYDLRLLTNDKRGAALTQPAQIVVPGLRREPGWWLFNGSPFVPVMPWRPTVAAGITPSPADAPLFVAGLKRDPNAKAKDLSRNLAAPSNGLVRWRTLDIDPGSDTMNDTHVSRGIPLQEMVKPDYDFNALRSQLGAAIQQARDKGERNLLGITIEGGLVAPQRAAAQAALTKLRGLVNEVAPDAALILRVPMSSPKYDAAIMEIIDSCAPQVDAVAFLGSNGPHVWPFKAARRVAEEQPNYDLPIFIQRIDYAIGGNLMGTVLHANEPDERQLLDFWMSGVTGVALQPDDEVPHWAEVVQRNSPLFIGAVTLEDTGLLPSLTDEAASDERTSQLYDLLRAVQRVPLLARAAGKGNNPESFLVSLGEKISRDDIAQLKSAATGGARIYVEGTPETENAEDAKNLASVLGGTFKRAVAETAAPQAATMTLEDPWLFGLSRGQKLPVEKRGDVTPLPRTLAGQAKVEKGKDVLTEPRIVARLADGSPALIINPVDKGEVVWLPHRIAPSVLTALVNAAETGSKAAASAENEAVRSYYAAVAAYLQPALVQVRLANPKGSGAENVRVALRSSAKGTLLVALMNTATAPVEVAATLNARAGVALDLADEKELPLETRGNHITARVTIPANGWKLIALGASRKELDDERNAKRLTARLR